MSGVSSKYKRKISDENRLFQDEWETEYFVVPNKNSAATCLICRESITLKKYNISRHFTTKHNSFNDTFPPGSSLRNEKLQFFKRSLNQQQNVMSVALSQDSAVTKASYEICYILDGCPSMTGSENGFIALFKKKYNLTNLVTFHCFIHQENLIARAVNPDLEAVMKTVINIVNYIRAKELNHRKFTSLLEELKSEYSDVLLHTSVRWLSRGKVLERFFSLRHEIMLFLDQNNKIYPELQQDEWWCLLAFLCDITEKLNNVNQSLQGKDKIVSNMANTVFAFEEKISIFYKELQNKNLQNFSTMLKTTEDLSNISEKNCVIFLDYITALLNEFQKRFQDLRKIRKCLLLVENPWHLETTTIGELASVLNCNYSQLFDEFIDFKNDTNLEVLFKEKRENKEYVEFWSIVPQKYKMVQRSAQTLLTFFGSTYLCESSFSKMKYIKNLYRNKLTDSHLDDVIRLACSDKPDLDKVMKKRSQFQTSH
ncbi:general transcription factor II-I repeat domain-containing protein 2-like [Ostrinia furnacalis]|uniref:general transcription factor II-I repeat domain-containing protein 2-like n=1 Tax=Ostrinia furnacalis TaxID=93504 RepID=UPI00103F8BF0|nr:general transcription factor II-I repeat domain-containing protein 2-like [Ostrinia furnacalis]